MAKSDGAAGVRVCDGWRRNLLWQRRCEVALSLVCDSRVVPRFGEDILEHRPADVPDEQHVLLIGHNREPLVSAKKKDNLQGQDNRGILQTRFPNPKSCENNQRPRRKPRFEDILPIRPESGFS